MTLFHWPTLHVCGGLHFPQGIILEYWNWVWEKLEKLAVDRLIAHLRAELFGLPWGGGREGHWWWLHADTMVVGRKPDVVRS